MILDRRDYDRAIKRERTLSAHSSQGLVALPNVRHQERIVQAYSPAGTYAMVSWTNASLRVFPQGTASRSVQPFLQSLKHPSCLCEHSRLRVCSSSDAVPVADVTYIAATDAAAAAAGAGAGGGWFVDGRLIAANL